MSLRVPPGTSFRSGGFQPPRVIGHWSFLLAALSRCQIRAPRNIGTLTKGRVVVSRLFPTPSTCGLSIGEDENRRFRAKKGVKMFLIVPRARIGCEAGARHSSF